MAQSASTIGNRASETASNYAESAGEALQDGYERVSREAQRGYDYSVDTVKSHPMESVAIALGAGVLLGLMLGMSVTSSCRR